MNGPYTVYKEKHAFVRQSLLGSSTTIKTYIHKLLIYSFYYALINFQWIGGTIGSVGDTIWLDWPVGRLEVAALSWQIDSRLH